MDGIGFLGLGTMGRPMARRLLAAGHRVVVWNRSRPAVEELRGDGAEAAADLAEVFRLPVVMSMLSDDAGIRSLILDSGVLDGAECRVHVNLATVSAGFASEAEQRHTQRGIGYVAAPVLGRADVAAAGKLNVLAAGAPEALDLARPVLEPLAGRIWELGDDPARANVVKIAVNFLLAAAVEATAEATSLVESYGVEAAAFVELISGTLFPGPVYGTYGGLMAEQRYEPPRVHAAARAQGRGPRPVGGASARPGPAHRQPRTGRSARSRRGGLVRARLGHARRGRPAEGGPLIRTGRGCGAWGPSEWLCRGGRSGRCRWWNTARDTRPDSRDPRPDPTPGHRSGTARSEGSWQCARFATTTTK
ncbi:NAD(P)-dependent oxidoreductase [Streptomyces sp. NPDC058424]|uniref:NAD(P)-dependent oxidoreductase n=1 Tax=Streptomyces sp. NPDC058424 TaxID=3346491 RepID=UPI00365259DA